MSSCDATGGPVAEQHDSSLSIPWHVLLSHPAFNQDVYLTCKLLCVCKGIRNKIASHSTGVDLKLRPHIREILLADLVPPHQQFSNKLQQLARWLPANGVLLRSLDWEWPERRRGSPVSDSAEQPTTVLTAGLAAAAQQLQHLRSLQLASYSGMHHLEQAGVLLRSMPQCTLTSLALHLYPRSRVGPTDPAAVEEVITALASLQVLKSLELHDARSQFGLRPLALGLLLDPQQDPWAPVQPLPLDRLLQGVQHLSNLTRLVIGHLGAPRFKVGHLRDPRSLAYLPSQLIELSCGLCTEDTIDLSHAVRLRTLHLPAVCLSSGSVLPEGLHELHLHQVYCCGPLLGLKLLTKLLVSEVGSRSVPAELLSLTTLTSRCDVALHYIEREMNTIIWHAAIGLLEALPVKQLHLQFLHEDGSVPRVLSVVSKLTGLTSLSIDDISNLHHCRITELSMHGVMHQLCKLKRLSVGSVDCPAYAAITSVVFEALPTLTDLVELWCDYARFRPCTRSVQDTAGTQTGGPSMNADLCSLLHATSLTSLSLPESDVTSAELMSLAASLTALKALLISHMPHLGDESVQAIVAFTSLTSLHAYGCNISTTGAEQLTVLQHLQVCSL